MKRRYFFIILILAGLLAIPAFRLKAQAQTSMPIVHAVLFYSPTCPHCHYVITETLPPLMEKYGNQLQIIGVDITQPYGQTLFLAALQKFGVEEGGVPFLVVGDSYLVGSSDIPEKFPGLIESYLAKNGVDWPDIPGLRNALSPVGSIATPALESAEPAINPTVSPDSPQAGVLSSSPGPLSNFTLDPLGNSLAVIVLLGMIISIIWSICYFRRPAKTTGAISFPAWAIPLICVLGSAVAGYLTHVEVAQVSAVCGPVGDCNTVQQSEYARLFGILPIGILGLAGYMVIVLAWLVNLLAKGHLADLASLTLLALTTSGTLFSIYLTFLEPFIIGATCAWCLASAVLMTFLMLISVIPGKLAVRRLSQGTP